jgi:peptide/nickel transport system ATP-binding protein
MLQRVMIAIAISCDPQLLVADEPTTALDVTIQAEVLELLRRLRDERGLAVLFVSHDLAVITQLCDRIVVFYAGEIAESGPAEEITRQPRHPYTQALLRVASVGDFRRRELEVIAGQPPHVGQDITGCRFAARCPLAAPECLVSPVRSVPVGERHEARCVLAARAMVTS